MRVLFFLLLALAIAASAHANTTAAPIKAAETQALNVEREAAEAEADTAFWTKQLAIATVVLAAITVAATLTDLLVSNTQRRQDRAERIQERDADAKERDAERDADDQRRFDSDRVRMLNSLKGLEHVIWFFNRRCQMLEDDSKLRAKVLMRGLDAAMSRALGDDITGALTSSLTEQVYGAIFEAYDTLAFADVHQSSAAGRNSNGDPVESPQVHARARVAQLSTATAAQLVRKRRENLLAEWGWLEDEAD